MVLGIYLAVWHETFGNWAKDYNVAANVYIALIVTWSLMCIFAVCGYVFDDKCIKGTLLFCNCCLLPLVVLVLASIGVNLGLNPDYFNRTQKAVDYGDWINFFYGMCWFFVSGWILFGCCICCCLCPLLIGVAGGSITMLEAQRKVLGESQDESD